MKQWHRLPKEVANAPSLETFQARLDGALTNLIWLKMSLLIAGGWTRWHLKVLSHPNYSMILPTLHIELPAKGVPPQGAETLLQHVLKRLVFRGIRKPFHYPCPLRQVSPPAT